MVHIVTQEPISKEYHTEQTIVDPFISNNITEITLSSTEVVTQLPETPPTTIPITPSPTLLQPKRLSETGEFQEYTYFNSGIQTLSFPTYGNLAYNLSLDKHAFYYDPSINNSFNESVQELYISLLSNPEQDAYMSDFIDVIRSISSDPDIQAHIIISLVQYIPYRINSPYDYYYPYETLHESFGDCDDKSVLMVYLLEKIGYDAVFIDFVIDEHMAVGIKTSSEYDFHDTGYAYIEATQRSIITDTYKYENSSYHIIPYGTSLNSFNVSEEYTDAKLLYKYKNIVDTTIPNQSSLEEITSANFNITKYNDILDKYGIVSEN